jgi:SAM-dependent methyltransferase
VSAHTHDSIDWAARLEYMRRSDVLEASSFAEVAHRLVAELPAGTATVVDLGCGAGGMSAAFAAVLRPIGGTLVLVDAVPELLNAASELVRTAAGDTVKVHPIIADGAAEDLADRVPRADLVWASHVVHHLPDQLLATRRLAGLLRGGGRLALAEGGLATRMLPWDIGVGRPGLEHRLEVSRDEWFTEMRAGIPDMVRLPWGWNRVLAECGLEDVGAFSYSMYHPAPASRQVRDIVAERLRWLAEVGEHRLAADDLDVLGQLLDPDSPEYVAAREDVYLLSTRTVHHGRTRW